jgi:putative SOS response-associated peptidase YedK
VGPSEGWLAGYHDRAPVVVEPNEWRAWLDLGQDATRVLIAARPERFELA